MTARLTVICVAFVIMTSGCGGGGSGVTRYAISELSPFPGDVAAEPIAINASGQIVGFSVSSPGAYRAVMWQNGVISDLGIAGIAAGINDAGTIVGSTTDGRA